MALPYHKGLLVGPSPSNTRPMAMQINAGMMRALEAFQEAILMVDTTDPQCWTVLHVNKTFVEQTGAVVQQCPQRIAQTGTDDDQAQDLHESFESTGCIWAPQPFYRRRKKLLHRLLMPVWL